MTEEIRYVVADPLQKRSIHHPDAISIEDGELQEQADQLVKNYETVRIDTPAETETTVKSPAVVDAIKTMNEIDRDGNLPTPTVCELSGIKDNECDGADPVHKQSSHQSDGITSEDCELQDRADRQAEEMGNTRIEERIKKEEVPSTTIYYHNGGESFAEDLDQHMVFLPEVGTPTQEIAIDDIQVGDPGVPRTDDQDKVRQAIWRSRHSLIGKGNALPPAARGAVCDIDMGGANTVAERVRPVAPKIREKLADLIKGLLSAKIILPSTSP